MSDLFSKATVELLINGQQAQQTLSQLRQNALQLETAIAKAAATGNKADLKRLRKELTDTKRQIREIESATQQVEHTLRNLDKATPRELNKSLQTLTRQLEYIERGSEAWKAQVEKIRIVKAEIHSLNSELRDSEGFWDRLNRTMNDWQTTIMAGVAALTGLVMAGRNAVRAFADMDAEMANVRKYTGMDAEQVRELNEELKKMDTRTAREELNKLAQEAGRLGRKSQEDVVGFVKAADKINVALDDLGEGATLTLSKLTNIFGDEERLGTEKALLSVGSVINELSQNCTASAPYLANFAQRMAGVGAQADMTIPQIMALGAVLDSQGQKVEMSSTAVSKLIMDMFKQQDKIISATGLNAKKFKEVVVNDTNAGLMMLLEQLHSLGNIDVLAPVFKDMGEDGARAAQVISALAGNLEKLRWEEKEAAKAYEEATSVTREFEVQNNTVQAGIEKARKRLNELAVELGEKLLPVMRHVYSSASLTLRLMSTVISFVFEHRKALLSLSAAVIAYTVAVNLSTIRLKAHHAMVAVSTAASKAYGVVLVHLKAAHYGLELAVAKLTGNYARQNLLMTDMRKHAAALTNVYALLAAAVVAAGVAFVASMNRQSRAQKALDEVESEARKNSTEDITRVEMLKAVIEDETVSIRNRRKAIEELQGIIPDYHASLTDEGKLIGHNAEMLGIYVQQLKNTAKIQAAMAKLPEAEERLMKIQKSAPDNLKDALVYEKLEGLSPEEAAGKAAASPTAYKVFKKQLQEADNEVKMLNRLIDDLTAQNQSLSDQAASIPGGKDDGSGSGSGGAGADKDNSKRNEDRFQQDKEWKEREEALVRIAYATGQKNYLQYTERMREIEVEFNKRKLEHTDLSADERLQIEADYHEAVRKQTEQSHKHTIEEEEASYNERVASLKQRFIDGMVSYKVYEESVEQLEIEHLSQLSRLHEEGSKEQLQVQRQLQDKLFANQRRHQKEYEEAEKKHQDALSKMKEKYFGDSPRERQAKFDADFALLQEVYRREILAAGDNAGEKLRIEEAYHKARMALMEKYNIEGGKKNRFLLQQWNDDVMQFLESDFGQAMGGAMDTLLSGMSGIFQQLTSMVQAEMEIQTAGIEKKYEREISLAEGNTYIVKKLEKQKQKEIAQVKNEANKKMFAMQVIQAVAQTATNAINAYGSAAAIPLIGYILAPIAAATAVTAGMMQVAAIKKQQQASESQGYARGGFTKKGPKGKVAGVVHAGEWVASQELLQSPVARPIIDAMEYAQRTNTIGSLNAEDVSRSITAPRVLADSAEQSRLVPTQVVVQNDGSTEMSAALAEYALTMRLLKERLDAPFLTVNSVTGETGMKQAQDEYDKLIRNKTPKSRR